MILPKCHQLLYTIEQFMFFLEKVSDAAPNTAISLTPTLRAYSNPIRLGTKTG